jgi:RHS repeat-associated protein
VNELTAISGTMPPEATYQWDAQDRLIGVTTGANVVSLAYDGRSRLSSVLVEVSGMPVEDKRYVWNGDHIAMERDATGLVVRRFYGQGMSIAQGMQAGPYYYARDHLGSIREMIDAYGGLRAKFGSRSKLFGDVDSPLGFIGLLNQTDNLVLALYRAYDPRIARWLSRDPLRESVGPNLYLYALNDPLNLLDFTGREPTGAGGASGHGQGGGEGAGGTPWSPRGPCSMPFGPTPSEHANRNRNNRCPKHPPTMCGGDTEDDFEYDEIFEKWRGAGGNECSYDDLGNLRPDPDQTYNFYPDPLSLGHAWCDFAAHYWYGRRKGYVPNWTTPY